MSYQPSEYEKTYFCNAVASNYASDYFTTEAGKLEFADDMLFYREQLALCEAKGDLEGAEKFRIAIRDCDKIPYPLFADGKALTTAQVFKYFNAFLQARNALYYEFDCCRADRDAYRGYLERRFGFEEPYVEEPCDD